jgi:hypothetical protein
MSWGNKLVFVFIAFAALIGTLVYKAVNTKFELVSKDYYKDELRYQDKIDGVANAAAAGDISIVQQDGTIQLQLPATLQNAAVEGEAWFYCKTNASHDKRFSLKMDSGTQTFNTGDFEKDSYELKLQFTSGGSQYFYNGFITVR